MKVFTEVFAKSLNKKGEELCGDSVEVVQSEDSIIAVMADGLGSGVKANILSTLTVRIASTMLKEKASIEEVVRTIANTLPVCRVRKLAYSTFSILEISDEGKGKLFEFDNPPAIYIRNGKVIEMPRRELYVEEKRIYECDFTALPGDRIFLVSDGIIHAGVGGLLNLGWQWENVAEYLERMARKRYSVAEMVERLIETSEHLYVGAPGDDATVVGVGVRNSELVTLLVGPPEDKSRDKEVVRKLLESSGKKVVCGGTTANIVSRETGREIVTKLEYADPSIPPTAQIEGIDLVTEGLITLTKCLEKLRNLANANNFIIPLLRDIKRKKDGASLLVDILINQATHVNFLVGKAVNPAHEKDFFLEISGDKVKVVEEIARILKKWGKRVNVEYY